MKNNKIVLDHGTGGLLSQELIEDIIIPSLGERYLGVMEDSMNLNLTSTKISMTTDSFVVDPIFFKNGDIGKVSICGTINDLAVSGSTPKYLTLSFIIEEGFLISDLKRILLSIKKVSLEANIYIVAGDTKVVGKGYLDKIFINTAGIGVFKENISPLVLDNIKIDDDIIVSNYLGNHSIHILSMREGLGYESKVVSDCAPLNHMIDEIISKFNTKIHYIRDLTRGGLGVALNEISLSVKKQFNIKLNSLPIQHEVQMASDMLGINPIYLANEGNICLFVNPKFTKDIINLLQKNTYGKNAQLIGKVTNISEAGVIGILPDNTEIIIEHLYGMELPRLC